MKEIKIEKCPYCGGEELIDCKCGSFGGVNLVALKSYNAHKTYHEARLYALV